MMPGNNPLFELINGLTEQVRANWGGVHEIQGPLGVLGVEYVDAEDNEDNEEYAEIALMLPDEIYAVIDGGTYGRLFGIRIFKEDES